MCVCFKCLVEVFVYLWLCLDFYGGLHVCTCVYVFECLCMCGCAWVLMKVCMFVQECMFLNIS